MTAIRFLARFTHWLWMLVATIIISYAVLVIAGRMLLPSIDQYRPQLVERLSELTNTEVQLSSLSGAWPRLSPSLSADEIAVRQPGEEQTALEIGQIKLELSPLLSLWEWEPIWRRLELSNVKIRLVEDADGNWSLAGFPLGGGGGGFTPINMLLYSTFIHIDRLALTLDFYSGASVDLFSENILVENSEDFHRIVAKLTSAEQQEVASFVFEAQGDPSTPDSFDGDGYLRLHQIDLARGLNAIAHKWFPSRLDDSRDLSALVDAELWFDVRADGQASIVGRLQSDKIPLDWAAELAPIEQLSADFSGWFQPGEDWGVTMQSLAFGWGDYDVTPLDIRFGQRVGARWGEFGLDLSRFNLGMARSVLLKTELLSEAQQKIIAQLNPAGSADRVSIDFSNQPDTPPVLIRSHLTDLAVNPWRGAPGVKGMDGYLETSINNGLFVLDSKAQTLDFDGLFEKPINADYVSGAVSWQWNRELKEVAVISGPLQLTGDMGDISGQFFLDLPLNREFPPELFLQIGAVNSHSRYGKNFIPEFLDPDLTNWLDQSIGDATINTAGVIYRGSLREGMYAQRTFQLFVDVADAQLKFDPDWPALSDADASLVVSDTDLVAHVKQGQLGTLPVSDVDVALIDAPVGDGNQIAIRTTANTKADTLYQFLMSTPLRDQVEDLQSWQLAGDISADVNLQIPLSGDWQSGRYRATGQVRNGSMSQPEFEVAITDLSGQLNFDLQKGIAVNNIRGKLWDMPLRGTLKAVDNDIEISFSGDLNAKQLLNQFNLPSNGFVSGTTAAQGVLTLQDSDTGKPATLQLSSELTGLAVNLPEPFMKTAEAVQPFSATIEFADSPVVTATYGDQVALGFEVADDRFKRGYLSLNRFDQALPEQDVLHIAVQLDHLDLAVWQSELLDTLQQHEANAVGIDLPPITFEGAINELAMSDLELDNAVLKGALKKEMVEATLESQQASGTLQVPMDNQLPINVHLTHLDLSKPQAEDNVAAEASSFDPRTLRSMSVQVDEWRLDGKEMGRGDFELSATENGLTIYNLNANLLGLQLGNDTAPATLTWNYDGEKHSTELTGLLESDDLGAVLQELGLGNIMQSKHALFQTDVAWAGRPWEIAIERLTGQMTFTLEDGKFYTQSGTATNAFLRIVGLFNFETWLRRLKLDFTDLFKKGVSYDAINGSFVFENGQLLFPEPIVAETPSGKMQMQGQIDTINELIDARFVATLPVGTNLPWVAALAINLPAAAGVWLVSKVFKKQVDNLSSISYKIDGSWDDPTMTLERVFSDQNRAEKKKQQKAEKQTAENIEQQLQADEDDDE